MGGGGRPLQPEQIQLLSRSLIVDELELEEEHFVDHGHGAGQSVQQGLRTALPNPKTYPEMFELHFLQLLECPLLHADPGSPVVEQHGGHGHLPYYEGNRHGAVENPKH